MMQAARDGAVAAAAAIEIDIEVQSPLWTAQGDAEQTVRRAVTAAAGALSTPGGEVSILLTDDSAMRALNRTWRGIDKSTNVLSFPAPKSGAGGLLGDIAIAFETVQRECEEEGKTFPHHVAHLAVHGFLHLVGYDHETDADAERMEMLESSIMRALKMPDPYRARDIG